MKSPENDVFTPIYRGGMVFSAGQGNEESKRNWGEPLKIAIAMIDKTCPECDYSVKENGLRLGYENGRVFGGMCYICGWTFGIIKSGLSRGCGLW